MKDQPTTTTPGEFIASISDQLGIHIGETPAGSSEQARRDTEAMALGHYRRLHHTLFQETGEACFLDSGAAPATPDFMIIGGMLWYCAEKLDGDLSRFPENITELSSFTFIRKLNDEQLVISRNRDKPQNIAPANQ